MLSIAWGDERWCWALRAEGKIFFFLTFHTSAAVLLTIVVLKEGVSSENHWFVAIFIASVVLCIVCTGYKLIQAVNVELARRMKEHQAKLKAAVAALDICVKELEKQSQRMPTQRRGAARIHTK